MQLVIVHYHLDPGGVTRVVSTHLQALALAPDTISRTIIVTGPRQQGFSLDQQASLHQMAPLAFPVEIVTLESLEYGHGPALEVELPDRLLRNGHDPADTVVHIHNHSLGKNAAMADAVWSLSKAGYRLLLQIHDFAEDFRPQPYSLLLQNAGGETALQDQLYPQADHIHYAVLNRRDHTILQHAGISDSRLHWLPNPVSLPVELSDRNHARSLLARHADVGYGDPFVLYPVRGIRRKNLGEAILWSQLLPDKTIVGFTLPPPEDSPEWPSYETWTRWSDLPVRFGLGGIAALRYADTVTAADAMLTTSVAEGFGLVFLESSLLNQPLIGRDLPEITADFRDCGLEFPGLASSLEVPVDWINKDRYERELREIYQETLEPFNRPFEETQFANWLAEILDQRNIDFARLTRSEQNSVIERAAIGSAVEQLQALNPHVPTNLSTWSGGAKNRDAIDRHFSLAAIGKRLVNVYQSCLASSVSEVTPIPRPTHILDCFLSLDRFAPIRVQ